MRIHQQLTALTSFLALLVAGTSTFGQSMAPGPQGYGGYAGQTPGWAPMVPPTFQPTFATNDPSVLYPPGTPPHAYPFPDVSPHLGANVLQEQHYNRDGTWYNEIINRNREWYFTAEAMQMHFDGPGDNYVGNAPARVRPDTMLVDAFPDTFNAFRLAQGVGLGGAGTLLGPTGLSIGPGAYPFTWIQIDANTQLSVLETAFFPIYKVSLFEDNPSSPGFKLRGGYFNDDGTGMGVEGWYAFQNNEFFQVGQDHINGMPITQSMIIGGDITPFIGAPDDHIGAFTNGLALINFQVGGLPLNIDRSLLTATGVFGPDDGFTGTTVKYDLLYRLDIASEAGNVNLNFFLGNLRNRKSMRVAAFASARYLYMDEYFGFRGVDSGFGYDLTDAVDNGTFRPEDDIFGPLYPLFESQLQSLTTSHLAGPELGMRMDLGRSDRFNIWLQGSAGLMVNHERLRVRGFNIGDPNWFRSLAPWGLGQFDPSLDMFANDTRFSDVERHTTVSPTFNFGVNAEMDVLRYLPLLKACHVFDHAQLSLGYNFMFVGNLSRPAQSINWAGFPDFPTVRTDRDNFEAHQLSAGLTFEK